MAMSVRLDVKTERLVRRLAARGGRSKSAVLRQAIALLAKAENDPRRDVSPFAAIDDLVGCVRGGPPDLSTRTGERFRALLESRKRR